MVFQDFDDRVVRPESITKSVSNTILVMENYVNAFAVLPLRIMGSAFKMAYTRIPSWSKIGVDTSLERRPCWMNIAKPVLSNDGGGS